MHLSLKGRGEGPGRAKLISLREAGQYIPTVPWWCRGCMGRGPGQGKSTVSWGDLECVRPARNMHVSGQQEEQARDRDCTDQGVGLGIATGGRGVSWPPTRGVPRPLPVHLPTGHPPPWMVWARSTALPGTINCGGHGETALLRRRQRVVLGISIEASENSRVTEAAVRSYYCVETHCVPSRGVSLSRRSRMSLSLVKQH